MGKWVKEATKNGGYRLRRTYGKDAAPAKAVEREELGPETELETESTNYSSLTKVELVAAAEAAGLDTSGTKGDLIERLNG